VKTCSDITIGVDNHASVTLFRGINIALGLTRQAGEGRVWSWLDTSSTLSLVFSWNALTVNSKQ